MKAVLISIQPKWCELIASGKKTVEVRKTRPKLETPFKCYIYETKGKLRWCNKCNNTDCERPYPNCACFDGHGKVIGEFVCNEIEKLSFDALEITYMARKYRDANLLSEEFFKGTQVTYQEAYDYCEGMTYDEEDTDYFYGWRISDLVIYDKTRELSEFYHYCGDNPKCDGCEAHYYSNTECGKEDYCCSPLEGCKPIKRPPQSWAYVESEDTK